MQYEIEKDVAIPDKMSYGRKRNNWLKSIEVGSSIIVDFPEPLMRAKEVSRIRNLMRIRKMGSVQRKVSKTAVRIWRTA